MVKKLNQNESAQVTTHNQVMKLKSAVLDTFGELTEQAGYIDTHMEKLSQMQQSM